MDRSINSDDTMVASNIFDSIIYQIQQSSLNFHLQVSPFSAVISLKKSLATDKHGIPLVNCSFKSEAYHRCHSSDVKSMALTLEAELHSAKQKIANVTDELIVALETISILEKKLSDLHEMVKTLEISNKCAKAVADKLNSNLVEQRSKFEKEMAYIILDYRHEVKMWKKELGQMNKNHIKLQKKFENLHTKEPFVVKAPSHASLAQAKKLERTSDVSQSLTYCSICACHIERYVPEYFCGEAFNPACDKCKSDAKLDIEHEF